MRDRRADKSRELDRRHARGNKEFHQERGGLPNLSASLRDTNSHSVDLHGKRTNEVSGAIHQAIAQTRELGHDTLRIIHGFNSGTALSAEVQRVLFQQKKHRAISEYSINPSNPGETIVRL